MVALEAFIFLKLKWNLKPFGDGLNIMGHLFARLIQPAILQILVCALSPKAGKGGIAYDRCISKNVPLLLD